MDIQNEQSLDPAETEPRYPKSSMSRHPSGLSAPTSRPNTTRPYTDALAILDLNNAANPFMRHIAHDLALLQVMLSRAATALGNTSFVDEPPATATSSPTPPRPKPAAALQAYMRIAAEFRRTYQLLLPREPSTRALEHWRQHHARSQLDTDTTLETNARRDPVPAPPPTDDKLAQKKVNEAINRASCHHETALERWYEACRLSPKIARARIDEVTTASRQYEPEGSNVPVGPKTFEKLLREALPPP